MRKFVGFFILIIFFNCKAKKTVTEYKEVIRIDTLKIIKEREIVKRFTDTLNIESPCDSVTGKLKPFKQVVSTSHGKVSIQSNNGNITAITDLKEQVNEKVKSSKISVKDKTTLKSKKTVIYRTPFWAWLMMPLLFFVGYIVSKFY